MENLNAEKIIKVLEHCSNWTAEKGCKGCPYDGNCIDEDVIRDALALITDQEQRIKELAAEVADLKAIAEGYQKQFEDCGEDRAKLTEENERLMRICQSYALQYGTATDKEVFLKKERADTVRKMHSEIKERCIKGGIYPAFVASTIDQIAEEMLEGE